jgi:hypothetical protein
MRTIKKERKEISRVFSKTLADGHGLKKRVLSFRVEVKGDDMYCATLYSMQNDEFLNQEL